MESPGKAGGLPTGLLIEGGAEFDLNDAQIGLLGFAYAALNITLGVVIARLAEFEKFGQPILLGASRKRFIDKVTPAPPDRRLGGSLAVAVIGAEAGAAILRVHDVRETVDAMRVVAAVRKQEGNE